MMHCKCKTILGGKFYTSPWLWLWCLNYCTCNFFPCTIINDSFRCAMRIECTFQMVFVFQIIHRISVWANTHSHTHCKFAYWNWTKKKWILHSFRLKQIKLQIKQKILQFIGVCKFWSNSTMIALIIIIKPILVAIEIYISPTWSN